MRRPTLCRRLGFQSVDPRDRWEEGHPQCCDGDGNDGVRWMKARDDPPVVAVDDVPDDEQEEDQREELRETDETDPLPA
jgi:hypothetical protein